MKQKLVFFTSITEDYGGYEIESISLPILFSELNIDVDFIYLNNTPNIVNEINNNNINVFSSDKVIKLPIALSILKFLLKLKYLLLKGQKIGTNFYISNRFLRAYYIFKLTSRQTLASLNKYDIAYIIGQPKEININIAKLFRQLNKTVIYHEISHLSDGYIDKPGHQQFIKDSENIDYFIGCSLEKLRQAKKYYSEKINIKQIEQWAYFNEKTLLNNPNKKFGNKLVFGIVTRLSVSKGIIESINVLIKYIKNIQNKQIELLITGTGELTDSINYLIKQQNCENCIKLLGHVSPNNIADIYNGIDIFLQPSLMEGGPIVGLEAMASGCVVLSSDVGAMPERIQHKVNGLIFKRNDWVDFEENLEYILSLNSDMLKSISTCARQTYLQKYSRAVIKNNYKLFFESISKK